MATKFKDYYDAECARQDIFALPWNTIFRRTTRLTTALDHFDHFRGVLHHLRADSVRFVQKSVGNNLNDLMKADPDRAWDVIREWEAGPDGPATRWIIRHGTRSLRNGPPGADTVPGKLTAPRRVATLNAVHGRRGGEMEIGRLYYDGFERKWRDVLASIADESGIQSLLIMRSTPTHMVAVVSAA